MAKTPAHFNPDRRKKTKKIAVAAAGDLERPSRDGSHGLHRLTCYGDLTTDLTRFGRFTETRMVNED